jgi:hypothetical protein
MRACRPSKSRHDSLPTSQEFALRPNQPCVQMSVSEMLLGIRLLSGDRQRNHVRCVGEVRFPKV